MQLVVTQAKEAEQKAVEYGRDERRRFQELEKILDTMSKMLGEKDYRRHDYYEGTPFDQLPFKVASLLEYKHRTEGSMRPATEELDRLMEVLRWEINPNAAMRKDTVHIDGVARCGCNRCRGNNY